MPAVGADGASAADLFGGSSAIPITQAEQHGPSQAEGIVGFASREGGAGIRHQRARRAAD
jgi:hypothetical protein